MRPSHLTALFAARRAAAEHAAAEAAAELAAVAAEEHRQDRAAAAEQYRQQTAAVAAQRATVDYGQHCTGKTGHTSQVHNVWRTSQQQLNELRRNLWQQQLNQPSNVSMIRQSFDMLIWPLYKNLHIYIPNPAHAGSINIDNTSTGLVSPTQCI